MNSLIVLLVIVHVKLSDAIRCFECTEIGQPHLCTKVTFCSTDEYCFTDTIVSSSGNIVFNTGCRLRTLCSPNIGSLFGKRSDNITACTSCCMEDYCNVEGCGTKAVPRDQRGPYCYNCDSMLDPATCNQVQTCPVQETCILYSPLEYRGLPETVYRSHCETKAACEILSLMANDSNCIPSCCETDFCNTKCETPLVVTDSPKQPVTTTVNNTFHCNKEHGYIHLEGNDTHLCVKITTAHRNWDGARDHCKHNGGDLVVLDTEVKASLMRNKIVHDSNYNHQPGFWIGAKDLTNKNHFTWVNGGPVTHGDWSSGQPNNHGQDCASIWGYGGHYHWHDSYCTGHLAYICERK